MKIALIGYGKMGKAIERISLQRGHQIVSIIDINNTDDFDSDAFKSADVAIEFTTPATAVGNYRRAFAAGVAVVSGTTAWGKPDDLKDLIDEYDATFFWTSNFSVGVNIFFALNRFLARIMNNYPAYDVRMEETHHIHKLDAPSGTAITLAEQIIAELDSKTSWVEGRAPEKGELGITAFRRDEVPGIHTVIYESPVDTITVTHDAKSREGFALGAVVAAEWVAGRKGFLTMADMMKF